MSVLLLVRVVLDPGFAAWEVPMAAPDMEAQWNRGKERHPAGG